ncbi:MCM DNA helicase complex subunit [Basidiobolus ranarum]|uniref:DNA replication licensing factor MCM4 n=1 Tax=Basidiobolus ranarum TaxID=34480 RepID=A0ABR2W8D6_9FUNG
MSSNPNGSGSGQYPRSSSPLLRLPSSPGGNLGGASSPMNMPSSPPFAAPAPTRRFNNSQGTDVSSPLYYPPSSPYPSSSGARERHPFSSNTDSLFSMPSTPDASGGSRRIRGDIHSNQNLTRQYDSTMSDTREPSSAAVGSSQLNSEAEGPVRLIWGTTINIQDATLTFKNFLLHFKRKYRLQMEDQPVLDTDNEPFYPKLLQQMKDTEMYNLNLDCANLRAYEPSRRLYQQLIRYPQEIIPLMDHTLSEVFQDLFEEEEVSQIPLKVRPFNLESSVNLRELNPSDIDQLVSVKGLLIRATSIIPDLKQAFFQCSVCENTVTVGIDRGKIAEPTRCPHIHCNSADTMSLIHNRCLYSDKQVVRLQETPDHVPDGQTPYTVSLCLYDDLVDVVKPGDRLEITGIYRTVPVRINSRQRSVKSLYKTYVDAVHIKKSSDKRLAVDTSSLVAENEYVVNYVEGDELNNNQVEDNQDIFEISKRPDLYELLAKSLAPSIYELEDVKKGILLQLFGGSNKTFSKSGAPRTRGDINILLVGDPGTSKSQMLQYAHKIAPRGIYTSGKGSSAVGLTAYITRDPDTRQIILESGALVLSDGGICCIDEFDKMSDSTRSILHEVMEQQTVSVAKAGIITTLNARTSILACANPIDSKWNDRLSVVENINLLPSLLSRFDLVYLVLDSADEFNDRRLAKHLVSLYLEDTPSTEVNILPTTTLTKYISYAKKNIHPVISEEASAALVNSYVELRKVGEDHRGKNKRIAATTRQLESMIRLSEAHARMRYSETVDVADVTEASRLLREALKESATDPTTGQLDVDLLTTGISRRQREETNVMGSEMLKCLQELISYTRNDSIRYETLFKKFAEQSQGLRGNEFEFALRNLENNGSVSIVQHGQHRYVRKLD